MKRSNWEVRSEIFQYTDGCRASMWGIGDKLYEYRGQLNKLDNATLEHICRELKVLCEMSAIVYDRVKEITKEESDGHAEDTVL